MALVIGLVAIAGSPIGIGCDQALVDAKQSEPRDVQARMAAARSGIEWLIQYADEMPPGWAHPFLNRIHRVAPDDETAVLIEAALRNDSAPSRRFRLPVDLEDSRILRPLRMTPVLFELRRRKAVGQPYREELETIRRAIEENEESFWERVRPLQRAVYLHQFRDLGMTVPYDIDTLYREFRSGVDARPIENVAKDIQTLYVLTHLILVRSMYFREYVDTGEFDPMLPYMLRALAENLEKGVATSKLDVSAEILACLSLMRYPDDDHVAAARRVLISAQNSDGSWGEGSGITRKRVHATLGGVLGTIVFPTELRSDPDLASRP